MVAIFTVSATLIVAVVACILYGSSKQKAKDAKQDAKNAKAQAQEWADTPNTDIDFISRMRKRIRRKR